MFAFPGPDTQNEPDAVAARRSEREGPHERDNPPRRRGPLSIICL